MYQIFYDRRITKEIKSIPKKSLRIIFKNIERLASNPRPSKAEKLIGIEGWRIRVGEYRVLYQIEDKKKTIKIYRIKHRKEAYR